MPPPSGARVFGDISIRSSAAGARHMSSNLFKATVNEHLEGLPESMQSRLYEAPATCLLIFRLLPPLAKFTIMQMVFSERPVLLRDLDRWFRPGTRPVQFELLKRLKALHLILEDRQGQYITLHPTFRRNFRDCLTGTQRENAFGVAAETDDAAGGAAGGAASSGAAAAAATVSGAARGRPPTVAFLDAFALTKWESILHFMVGTEASATPSRLVLLLLRLGGLMEPAKDPDAAFGGGGGGGGLRITNVGFQFLLQDANAQIWTILLQYLHLSQELNMDPVDVLNFIFILGSLDLGSAYAVALLSATQVSMLADLKDYGLIYQETPASARFYPTRLATTLTLDAVALKLPGRAMEQATAARAAAAAAKGGVGVLGGLHQSPQAEEQEHQPRGGRGRLGADHKVENRLPFGQGERVEEGHGGGAAAAASGSVLGLRRHPEGVFALRPREAVAEVAAKRRMEGDVLPLAVLQYQMKRLEALEQLELHWARARAKPAVQVAKQHGPLAKHHLHDGELGERRKQAEDQEARRRRLVQPRLHRLGEPLEVLVDGRLEEVGGHAVRPAARPKSRYRQTPVHRAEAAPRRRGGGAGRACFSGVWPRLL